MLMNVRFGDENPKGESGIYAGSLMSVWAPSY